MRIRMDMCRHISKESQRKGQALEELVICPGMTQVMMKRMEREEKREERARAVREGKGCNEENDREERVGRRIGEEKEKADRVGQRPQSPEGGGESS